MAITLMRITMRAETTALYFVLITSIVIMFILIATDIYLRKDHKKKMDKMMNDKNEEFNKIFESLRKLHDSMEEVNKLKKEVNEIKVSRK